MKLKLLLPTLLLCSAASAQSQTPQIQFTPVQTSAPLRPDEAYGLPQGATLAPAMFTSINLPDTPELRKEVTLTVPLQGLSLSEALTLIGKTTGLNVLTQNVPDYQLRTGLGPMPAGKTIETLLNLYAPGITAAQVDKLLIVGPPDAIARVQGMTGSAQTTEVISSPATSEQLSRLGNLLSAKVIPYAPGTLIVSGSTKQVQDAKDLLTRLDSASAGSAPAQAGTANVKRVTIESPNVTSETELLKALFPGLDFTALPTQNLIVVRANEDIQKEVQQALEEARSRSSALVTVYYPTTYSAEQLATTLSRAYPTARISAVEGRNMVMVRATETQQVTVSETIRQLQGAQEVSKNTRDDIISRSIKLGYSDATSLAGDLKNLSIPLQALANGNAQSSPESASTQNAALQTVSTTSSAPQTQINLTPVAAGAAAVPASSIPNLTILADDRTNSLLIVGPRGVVEEMVTAVQTIDVPVQAVRVNLKVLQVKQSDAKALGLDWKLGLGGVTFGQQNGSLSLGYTPSLTPASIEAKLNATLSNGNGRTLIDSQFTALSGQETKFQNGGELVFRPQSSTVGDNTVQTPAQTYSYGLDITMRPRIAPDGTVVLVLDTTLGNPPVRGVLDSIQQTRQALKTTVQIRPGETVVLGGVVTSSVSNSSSGIPGLRDLPVIGPLFGQQSTDRNDDALLFVLEAEEAKAAVTTARQTVQAEPAPQALPVKVAGEPNLPPSPPAPLPAAPLPAAAASSPAAAPAVSPTGVQRVEILPEDPVAPSPSPAPKSNTLPKGERL
ncbi:type II and III secretion system protein (plasmid) [Deinococcus proteolyticus MRP]|uniref:Type II and III secretion system protein n=1 Tax=Deinococcus proteolyticus (strain ATCC 35074 / DSM 20540 / JCM 6276 / NBRC 101906 / NCIMB 13154 / VKM Ac-1939 / CCM 2703 / MRP) TaxID=693977 RepID=F0RQL2_DEIPM|nr:secretin N-terminal domain-containing protein [Deinococcus proteolyticus]ADY27571.1 type II and III secretion system protein [Deinococcus proteolyticus MRP]